MYSLDDMYTLVDAQKELVGEQVTLLTQQGEILNAQTEQLEQMREALVMQQAYTAGIICFLGVIAGIVLFKTLWSRFKSV